MPIGQNVDEAKWNKAKEAAKKEYAVSDKAYWPVVQTIYKKMTVSDNAAFDEHQTDPAKLKAELKADLNIPDPVNGIQFPARVTDKMNKR